MPDVLEKTRTRQSRSSTLPSGPAINAPRKPSHGHSLSLVTTATSSAATEGEHRHRRQSQGQGHGHHHHHRTRHLLSKAENTFSPISEFFSGTRDNLIDKTGLLSLTGGSKGESRAGLLTRTNTATNEPIALPSVEEPVIKFTEQDVARLQKARRDVEQKFDDAMKGYVERAGQRSEELGSLLAQNRESRTAITALADNLNRLRDEIGKANYDFMSRDVPKLENDVTEHIDSYQMKLQSLLADQFHPLNTRLETAQSRVTDLTSRIEALREQMLKVEQSDAEIYKLRHRRRKISWSIIGVIVAAIIAVLVHKSISKNGGQELIQGIAEDLGLPFALNDSTAAPPVEDDFDPVLHLFDEL